MALDSSNFESRSKFHGITCVGLRADYILNAFGLAGLEFLPLGDVLSVINHSCLPLTKPWLFFNEKALK
jgi:hypothetical protein